MYVSAYNKISTEKKKAKRAFIVSEKLDISNTAQNQR